MTDELVRPKIVALSARREVSLVDDELVKMLRELLDDAERGKMIGVCGVAEYADDEPTYFARGLDDTYRACGLLDGLKEFLSEL